ncbi:hypothetical protein [Streptomyces sp. NPDC051109]|uniref:hypothetical protein n=1 Tax=Streptomyces sp. NPDC051109 TaxID=3365642 RepID=UPI0037B8A8C6
MFIRPVGTRVEPARRPTGHPLLQGLLARAAGRPPVARDAEGPSDSDAAGAEPTGSAGLGAGPQPTGHEAVGHAPEEERTAGAEAAAPERRTTTGGGGPLPPPVGLATELAQLANLAREGLLTPQEFKEAKTRLLHS